MSEPNFDKLVDTLDFMRANNTPRETIRHFLRVAFTGRDCDDLTTAKREAARDALEAVKSAWKDTPIGGDCVDRMLDVCRRYLDATYPLPARECVLSDGSVVTYNEHRTHLLKHCDGHLRLTTPVCQWRDLAIAGADFDKLKSFAAGVER